MADDMHDKRWRDFKFTVDVVLASALAREDLAEAQLARAPSLRSLRFSLLAASTTEQPTLPAGEWRDDRQQLSVSVVESGDELRITFQAIGYAAMTRYAGRAARMVSSDGEIEVAFRFDSSGRGIAVLANTASVRRGLVDFTIVPN